DADGPDLCAIWKDWTDRFDPGQAFAFRNTKRGLLRFHRDAVLDEPIVRDLRSLTWRVRHLAARVELDHHHAGQLAPFHQIENADEIHLAEPERAVAGHRRTANPILEVHVLDDRQERLDDGDRIHAAFLELTDVGTELHVARINSFHRRVGFIARLDDRASV